MRRLVTLTEHVQSFTLLEAAIMVEAGIKTTFGQTVQFATVRNADGRIGADIAVGGIGAFNCVRGTPLLKSCSSVIWSSKSAITGRATALDWCLAPSLP